jgi:hypothetical protein
MQIYDYDTTNKIYINWLGQGYGEKKRIVAVPVLKFQKSARK